MVDGSTNIDSNLTLKVLKFFHVEFILWQNSLFLPVGIPNFFARFMCSFCQVWILFSLLSVLPPGVDPVNGAPSWFTTYNFRFYFSFIFTATIHDKTHTIQYNTIKFYLSSVTIFSFTTILSSPSITQHSHLHLHS